MNGFTDDQIIELRQGKSSVSEKFDALAAFVKNILINRSKPDTAVVDRLFEVGYTNENLIDIIVVIGDKIISNFVHGTTQIPVDFPAAPELEEVQA